MDDKQMEDKKLLDILDVVHKLMMGSKKIEVCKITNDHGDETTTYQILDVGPNDQ